MSRRFRENAAIAEKLFKYFYAYGWPSEYPWLMEFLAKVSINDGRVNTDNQQDTLDVLWKKYEQQAYQAAKRKKETYHMSRYGEKHVIARGVILWDGITRPEQKDDGKGGKRTQYSLKLALLQTAPEVAEITAIATDALNADTTFKGRLPAGGCWPILPIDAHDFEGRLPSHVAFNAKTYRTPQVFDINKQEIAPMIYQNMLYAGCIVDVLVSAFAFSNVSKGIALSLDGIMIVDATAPRLPVGGVDAAAAFGGAPLPGGPTAPPVYQPPAPTPVVTGQYVAPGGGYQPPVGGYQPPAAAQPPLAGVQPAPDFLNPPVGSMGATPPVLGGPPVGAPPAPPAPVKQMTAKAAGPYEAYVKAGWSDAQLIQEGLMVG